MSLLELLKLPVVTIGTCNVLEQIHAQVCYTAMSMKTKLQDDDQTMTCDIQFSKFFEF